MAPSRPSKPSPPASSLGFSTSKPGVKSGKAKREVLNPITSSQSARDDDLELEVIEPGPSGGLKARSGAARAALLSASKKQLGKPMVQQESLGWTNEQLILHIFDTDDSFGPAACGSRLDRFRRAQRLGLNPPAEIEVILDEASAAVAAEERRKDKADKARLRAARQLLRPYTAAPLEAEN